MPASHGKQKRLQKQKKRREAAKKQQHARRSSLALPRSRQEWLKRAVSLPPGPSFISPSWRDAREEMPKLVTVIVTRQASGGLLVPASAIVDRTCLGVKDGFLGRPVTQAEMEGYLGSLAQAHGEAMEPCDLIVAQSVVFHALDYARSLGFSPHHDFPEAVFGPRPEKLLDTPLARPSRPIYVSGPHDDVPKIVEKLRRAAGDDFSLVVGGVVPALGGADLPFDVADEDEDDETDGDEDDGEPDPEKAAD